MFNSIWGQGGIVFYYFQTDMVDGGTLRYAKGLAPAILTAITLY